MMIDADINDMIIKEQKSTPLVSETQTEAKVVKSRKQMSCFKCHQKGHVASCCPNKKLEASHKLVNNDKTLNVSSLNIDRLGTKPRFGSKSVNTLKRDGPLSVSPPKLKQTDNSISKSRDKILSRFRTPSRNYSQYENGSTIRAQEFNHGYHNRTHSSMSRRFSSKIRDKPSL